MTALPLHAPGIFDTDLDAPESAGLVANSDVAFSEEIFNIPAAEIEAIAEPDGVGNDIWLRSMTLLCRRGPILAIWAS